MSGKHQCGQTEQFLPLTWLPFPSPVLGGQSLAAMWSLDMTDWASAVHGPVPEYEKGVGAWLDERTEAQCCDYGHL